MTVSSGACTPGGPITTITQGEGYISLPGISSDGSSDPGTWIKMKFEIVPDQPARSLPDAEHRAGRGPGGQLRVWAWV